jgi:hypothetical protein
MTVNEATGYSPFYLVYGREPEMPSGEFLETRLNETEEKLEEYVKGFVQVMRHTWEGVSWKFIQNVDEYNKIPKEPLQFEPYEVGDYFMLRKHPKRHYIDSKTRRKGKLTAKLQFRWVGPYRITRVISPVLYDAMIHGKEVRVHAVNMKPKTENWHEKQLRTDKSDTSGRQLQIIQNKDGILVLRNRKETNAIAGGDEEVEDVQD